MFENELHIENYGAHVTVYLNGETLGSDEAIEVINEILEAETDAEGYNLLSNTIRLIELEKRGLS